MGLGGWCDEVCYSCCLNLCIYLLVCVPVGIVSERHPIMVMILVIFFFSVLTVFRTSH